MGNNSAKPKKRVGIVLLGNPAVGKSTLGNCLAGKILFKSGQSYGDGLTVKFMEGKTRDGTAIYDTPGLQENNNEKAADAAKEITRGMKAGGSFKIIFVVRCDEGRTVKSDALTMQLILEACPEIGNTFAVIVNKVHPRNFEDIRDDNKINENCTKFLNNLFSAFPGKQPPHNRILFIRTHDELYKTKGPIVKDLNTLKTYCPNHDIRYPGANDHNVGLEKFVKDLPHVDITRFNDIKIEILEEMTKLFLNHEEKQKQINELQLQKLKKNNELIRNLKREVKSIKAQIKFKMSGSQ